MESNKGIAALKEIKAGTVKNGYVVLRVGSGKYHFTVNP
jgi:hypothetical protein